MPRRPRDMAATPLRMPAGVPGLDQACLDTLGCGWRAGRACVLTPPLAACCRLQVEVRHPAHGGWQGAAAQGRWHLDAGGKTRGLRGVLWPGGQRTGGGKLRDWSRPRLRQLLCPSRRAEGVIVRFLSSGSCKRVPSITSAAMYWSTDPTAPHAPLLTPSGPQVKLDMELRGTILLRSTADDSVHVLQTERLEQVGSSGSAGSRDRNTPATGSKSGRAARPPRR